VVRLKSYAAVYRMVSRRWNALRPTGVQTETYFVLECEPGAAIELDGERVPVQKGVAVMIPPGVRHRAVGKMTILNVVVPPFDPADEWFD
jgi:mannose-6-phosphate isomerase-like protein (cupin superfamily)